MKILGGECLDLNCIVACELHLFDTLLNYKVPKQVVF